MSDNLRDDGGPAFPNKGIIPDSPLASMNGMTLRDWFAGQAMNGYLSGRNAHLDRDTNPDAAARSCLLYADAMIAARKEVM